MVSPPASSTRERNVVLEAYGLMCTQSTATLPPPNEKSLPPGLSGVSIDTSCAATMAPSIENTTVPSSQSMR